MNPLALEELNERDLELLMDSKIGIKFHEYFCVK